MMKDKLMQKIEKLEKENAALKLNIRMANVNIEFLERKLKKLEVAKMILSSMFDNI